jgi:hypothetical protein
MPVELPASKKENVIGMFDTSYPGDAEVQTNSVGPERDPIQILEILQRGTQENPELQCFCCRDWIVHRPLE